MYWSVSRGSDHWISKAGLDGSNETRIRNGFPTTIALDGVDRRLYWTEFLTVQSTKLDGSDYHILKKCPDFYECDFTGLAVNGEVVYLGSKLSAINGIVQGYAKSNGSLVANLPTPGTVYDLAVFGSTDDVRVSSRQNDCEARPCSHLCVLGRESFKCLCPRNMVLGVDQRTCE